MLNLIIDKNEFKWVSLEFLYRPGQANVQFSLCDTVWKFHDFTSGQNLREIDFEDSRSE